MVTPREQFDHELAEILREETGTGLYSLKGFGPDGVECVHRFAQAEGLGSWMWAGKYRRRLGAELPDWTEFAHPYHVSQMCQFAIEHRRRLPKIRPELARDKEIKHVQP